MTTLEYDLTIYPDPRLRVRSADVTDFDQGLADIVRAMFERMYASRGVGLAAPQVGLKIRLFVLNEAGEPGEGEEMVFVNPTIVERAGSPTLYEEGCLSFPGIYAEVERPDGCRVKWQDLEGKEHEATFGGFVSRIVQHEYDHLEGVLLVDRMSPADKLRQRGALEELVETYKRANAKETPSRGPSWLPKRAGSKKRR
ncbi:MAG: peptide deformylase [Planctomycetota bacterium]